MFFAGYYRATPIVRFGWHTLSKKFWLVFIAYSLFSGVAYIINQIVDRESDRLNRKLFLIADGYIPVSHAITESIILTIIGVFLLYRMDASIKIIAGISFLMGIMYSLPPFSFKARAGIDLIFNAVGYGFFNFAMGWLINRPLEYKLFLNALPYIFAVAGIFGATTLLDIEGDKETGKITLGVKFGFKPTLLLSTGFIIMSLVFSIIVKDIICAIVAGIATLLFLYTLHKPDLTKTKIAMRLSAPILTLLLGIFYPQLLILCFVTFILMKIYYKLRFGIDYPSIKG